MKSTEYQAKRLPMWRRFAGLDEGAKLSQIVEALVAKGEHAEATELIFASERTPELTRDRIGFGLYLQLWMGKLPRFISEIALHHHWSDRAEGKGFSIQVYPGEYLVIEEPTATNVLKALYR